MRFAVLVTRVTTLLLTIHLKSGEILASSPTSGIKYHLFKVFGFVLPQPNISTSFKITMASSEIEPLIKEVNSIAQKLLLPGDHGKDTSVDERARQSLILAAEKLVIASRRPDENIYATATNVEIPYDSSSPCPH